MKDTTASTHHKTTKGQDPLSYHNQESELGQPLGPKLEVPPGGDLGLGNVSIRLAITAQNHNECCYIKDECQPKLHWKRLHPSCDAPASLDHWGEESAAVVSDGRKGSDCPAIPTTIAIATVGTIAIAATVVGPLVAPGGWMPAPLLVLGAVPVVNFINGDLLSRVIRSWLVP